MTRAVTLLAIVVTRAAIAATLAHAVLPSWSFVAVAAALDAVMGAALGMRIVHRREPSRGLLLLELSLRGALLYAATRAAFGESYLDLFSRDAWPGSSLGTIIVAFAPVFVGRLAIVLLADVWRAPRLHPDERMRRATLAAGVTLLVTGACIAALLRSPAVAAVAGLSLVLVARAVRDGARRRRWLAAVRAGEIATHRLDSESSLEGPTLDEAPDSLLIATAGPDAFRSAEGIVARVRARGAAWWVDAGRTASFAFLALLVTAGFDGACWHGSGWIPVRAEAGDFVLRPVYSRALKLVEWTMPYGVPKRRVWRIADGRFETDEERFARWSVYEPRIRLQLGVPPSSCAARETVVEQAQARSLDERARIVDPTSIDGALLYTVRRADGQLVRVEIARDGKSSTCIEPRRLEVRTEPLWGAHELALDGARSCAIVLGELQCWGRNPHDNGVAHALPQVLAKKAHRLSVGEVATCWDAGGLFCAFDRSSAHASFLGPSTVFASGGGANAYVDEKGALRIGLGGARLVPPPEPELVSDVRGLALATDRACALRGDGTLHCFGPTAPRLENEKAVVGVALGAELACVIRDDKTVWCAEGDAPPKKVNGVSGVRAIDVGTAHACAIDAHRDVWCWGSNSTGQLGDGSTTDRATPARVLGNAHAIATGAAHTCASDGESTVRCWGSNSAGQLGDGTFADRVTPVTVIR